VRYAPSHCRGVSIYGAANQVACEFDKQVSRRVVGYLQYLFVNKLGGFHGCRCQQTFGNDAVFWSY